MQNSEQLKNISTQVRRDIIRMVTNAASGHPGGSLSSADILTALYFSELNHDPANWKRGEEGKDLFFLSAGHISPVFYSVLARSGYFEVNELNTFRQFGSRLQGHPSVESGLPGVEQAAGSLGQGLSTAVGAALAKRINKDESTVFCLVGDGECEEGQIWEAALFASQHKVGGVIAMTDLNGQQIDGPVDAVMSLGDLKAKWESFGWDCIEADGHDMDSIVSAIRQAKELRSNDKPKMILFKTIMGCGVDFMSGTHHWHGKAPSKDQCSSALEQLKSGLSDF